MEAFTATDSDAGKRLDQWLNEATPLDLSRSRLKALILDGQVMLNGAVVSEPKRKIAEGDRAQLTIPDLTDPDPEPENIALNIVFEDADLIVINKPSGLVVHPGAGNHNGTLVNALLYHCADTLSGIGGVKRPGIVHRLDKETSGIMVVAKNDHAHRNLSAQFADHGRTGQLRRIYRAVVWGAPPMMTGTIDTYLGRSGSDRTKQAVVGETQPDARHAITHYELLERFGAANGEAPVATLIDCTLETGRTHQIRVHMAHLGNPLVGDGVYGAGYKTKINTLPEPLAGNLRQFHRQALHARALTFEHPSTGALMRFDAEEPDDMKQIIAHFTAM